MPSIRVTERDWQRTVIDYAKLRGWHHRYHTQHSLGSRPGFPDWVLVRDRVVFAELKGDQGQLTVAQAEWITALVNAGQEAYVWWPNDWDDLVRILK